MEKRAQGGEAIRALAYLNQAFIGIDPGQDGGIALNYNGAWFVHRYPKNKPTREVFSLLNKLIREAEIEGKTIHIFLEHAHSMPGQGVASTFKFGMNYGIWVGLTANRDFTIVSPQKWQSIYDGLPRVYSDRKRMLKQIAKGVVGDSGNPPTLCTADAICIANYGKEAWIESRTSTD